jgi:UDPglucose 6-dehydrogenase
MNGEIKETLEQSSGKKIGLELGICYNPEFIALGSVIHDMQYPDMQLLGASQEWAAKLVEDVLTSITATEVPIRRMSLEEAEIVKISINNFVTSKIAFANMLYELSFNFANVNIDVVTESIGLDSRIGGKYLKGGAPFGGPCFPRDTRALAALLNDFSIGESIPRVIERFNDSHTNFLVKKIISETNKSDIVGFIGVSYKQFTKVTEESPSLLMAKALIAAGREVICWDPNIDNSDDVPTWMELVDSLEAICLTSNYLVLARPLPEINQGLLMAQLGGKRLFDIWRQLDGVPLNRQLV